MHFMFIVTYKLYKHERTHKIEKQLFGYTLNIPVQKF